MLGLLGSSTVFGQRNDYKVAPGRDTGYDAPPDAKPAAAASFKRQIREKRNEVRQSLLESDLSFNKEREAAFDKWYLGYEFPTLTLYTPEALKDLYEGRKRLFKEELERANNTQAREHLVDLAFKFFKEVAREDYHPAVRYNAMLIVGELNAREPNRSGANQTAPLPVRPALGFMIQEFKNPDQIDAVRLAALLGINRHVQLDAQSEPQVPAEAIPQAELQEVRTLALELVKTRQAPAGRSQEGHDWMRRRGLEILSWLAAGKLDQEIVDEIIARLSDSDENRGIRAEAALAMNTVKFQPEREKPRLGSTPVTIKPKEVAAHLLQFIQDVVTADVEHVDKYIKSMEEADTIYTSSAGGGGFSGGRMSGRSSSSSSGMGKSSMGPAPGGSGSSSRSSMGPAPGGSSSGSSSRSSMGPTPGGSSKGGSSMMKGSGSGGFGGYNSGGQADPYAYRLDPVYRKLRYEIACAMKGLRGTDDWRSGAATNGLYRAKPTTEETEFLDRCAKALRDIAAKLKVKSDELETRKFTVEKLAVQDLTKLINEVANKAKPKAAGPELKDPLNEPDPADELSEPEKPTVKTTAAGAAVKAKK